MSSGLFRPLLLLLFVPIEAFANFYGAPITESTWTISVTRAVCSLSHDVPNFGRAVFSQSAGEMLSFQLQPKRKSAPVTRASLTVSAPAWMHEVAPSQQYAVYQEKPSQPGRAERLVVHDQAAELMLNELNAGWFPTFIYTTASPSEMTYETRVAVSAVNFRAASEVFSGCRDNLLPISFAGLRNSHLFFDPSSTALDLRARSEVGMMAEYLALMPERTVLITPYSSWGGKSARNRFDQRVAALTSILSKKGIKAGQVRSVFKRSALSSDQQVINLKLVDPSALKLLHYRPKSLTINRREKQQLGLLAEYFKEKRNGSRIVVNGHTDSNGGRKSNKKISAQRAEVVRQFLISQGISPKHIRVKAWGERKPVSSNRSTRGQANNRRVEIKFIG